MWRVLLSGLMSSRSDEQSRRANGGTGHEIDPDAPTTQTPRIRASSINVKIKIQMMLGLRLILQLVVDNST